MNDPVAARGDAQEPQLDAKALRERILGADDLPLEKVPCPEWGEGVQVSVRTLTAAQRNAMETPLVAALRKLPESPDDNGARGDAVTMACLVACCVDAEGVPLFTAADAAALLAKNSRPIARILAVADRLNGILGGSLETLQGN